MGRRARSVAAFEPLERRPGVLPGATRIGGPAMIWRSTVPAAVALALAYLTLSGVPVRAQAQREPVEMPRSPGAQPTATPGSAGANPAGQAQPSNPFSGKLFTDPA